MRRTDDGASLTQMLGATPAAPSLPRRARATVARRATANLALAMGVMATAVSLGVLVGQLGRALAGG
jgi:hypothetical protein